MKCCHNLSLKGLKECKHKKKTLTEFVVVPAPHSVMLESTAASAIHHLNVSALQQSVAMCSETVKKETAHKCLS